tara:strand:- start:547 stop:879 length:333 start_codon:yes stop_codon:yes gene_type:complete
MIEKTLILTKKKTKNLGQEGILIGKEGKDQDLNPHYLNPRKEVQVEIPVAEQWIGKGNRVDMVYRVGVRVEERPEVLVKKRLSEDLLSVPLKEHTHEGETSNLLPAEISV